MKTIGGRFQAAALIGAAALALAFAAGTRAQNQNSQDQNSNNNQNSYSDSHASDNTWPYARTSKPPVLAVVGDVACQPDDDQESGEKSGEDCAQGSYGPTLLFQSQQATAAQIEAMKPALIALVGDEQYQVGQYQDFEQSYETTYGAFKSITRPAPGNHEFYTEHGAVGVAGYGYFSYFNGHQYNSDGSSMTATVTGNPDTGGAFTQPVPFSDGQAGHFAQSGGLGNAVYATGPAGVVGTTAPVGVGDGWYSYNLGGWHLISLNIECETQPGGCSDSADTNWFAQETEWLKNDLAADHSPCTLAYWHQPTYSAADSLSLEGNTAGLWWQILYDAGADLVLNGHDHLYARYAPIKPVFNASDDTVGAGQPGAIASVGTWLGTPDPKKGIREFIVGTGGETLDTVVSTPCTTSGTTACAASVTPATDYDAIFNSQNLQAASGFYWGVMGLTLDPNGYQWDFESALLDPAQTGVTSTTPKNYSDTGSAMCHGGPFGDNQGDQN